MMSRKRPRSEDVEAALQLSDENSSNDAHLNGHHNLSSEESHFLNGASGSGVEYSPPVVSTNIYFMI